MLQVLTYSLVPICRGKCYYNHILTIKKLIFGEVKLFVQGHSEKLAQTRLKPMHVRTLLLSGEQSTLTKSWLQNSTIPKICSALRPQNKQSILVEKLPE